MTNRTIRKLTAKSFKPVEGGYLFRTSNPWLVGTGSHYIVNEAQKEALTTVIPPRHPLLFASMLIPWGAMFGAFSSNIGSLISAHTSDPVMGSLCFTMAAALPQYVALVIMIRERLGRMVPILANAVRVARA
jgi:hypothetical protein